METLLDFEKPIVELQNAVDQLKKLSKEQKGDFEDQIRELDHRLNETKAKVYENLTDWQIVQLARHPGRPVLQDYIARICSQFVELHGDRLVGDDRALIGGFATIDNIKVMLIGHNKGKTLDERMQRNFGCAHPEGYRKALRLMKLAEKYRLPIVTFVDTSAAAADKESEGRGQHEAIARNLLEMIRLEVPVIAIIIGEGGSGGALAIAVADIVCMLSYSIYSVIPPEGCASILWHDASVANSQRAAQALKLTSPDLLRLGVIDEIIKEPIAGAHTDFDGTAAVVRAAITHHLKKLKRLTSSRLLSKRFDKYVKMGDLSVAG